MGLKRTDKKEIRGWYLEIKPGGEIIEGLFDNGNRNDCLDWCWVIMD